jgi:hypothetical protein
LSTIPLSGTNIRLLSGIPFNRDYKHTRWFDTQTAQENYFLSKTVVHSMEQATFQKIEGKNYISVNSNIDSLWGTNYVMFQNASYNTKWFYGFVTKLEYKNPGTTHVHFEIDVFQTWLFEMNFKPSYVSREHCPLWNADGSPYINIMDEGLDYGTEYDTVFAHQYQPNNGWKWLVILCKTPMHSGSNTTPTPTVIGTPQPLTVYMIPFMDDDTVPSVILKDGSGVLISKPTDVLTNLYSADDSVNNVVSLYITDYTGIPIDVTADGLSFPNNNNEIEAAQIQGATAGSFFNCLHIKKVKEFASLTQNIGDVYAGYRDVKESKLMMYPYTILILDDFKGNRVTFKNEFIYNNQLAITTKGSLGTSNKTSYSIKDYNYGVIADPDLKESIADEFALINNTPNDVPILNDMLAAFLQGNRNSLQNQRDSIVTNGEIGGIQNGIGAIMGLMSPPSGVGAANFASQSASYAGGLANTYYQLQAQASKNKDIANIPPSIGKMGSNTSYNLGNKYNGVYIIKKQIKVDYQRKLEDFFNMFGYKLGIVKIPNFHTRQNWNYVQTTSCSITGNFNNEDLVELKNIFDSGITLWHTDDVFNYDLDNPVI